MGARLEYIVIPLAFGFGTTIVAMVGTNWGAKQYRRAREIAWTGAVSVATACATIGLIVAIFPTLWMELFTRDDEVICVGATYLRIVGPICGLYGLGMALYFATQGFGSVVWTVTANAVRLLANAACALVAIFWLDLGVIGFFVAVAMGFCAYGRIYRHRDAQGEEARTGAGTTRMRPHREPLNSPAIVVLDRGQIRLGGNRLPRRRTGLYCRSWTWPLLSTTRDTSLPFFIALTDVPSAVDLISRICE